MTTVVDNFLAHYASEYYDPVKAKAYYERTKKLKGRKKANALTSKAQSDAWAVTKDSISTARTNDLNKASEETQQALDTARANAEAASERIQAKLTDFLQQVMSDTPIPGNASPRLRAFLQAQRTRRAQGAVKEANADLQKVGSQLKAAIATARQSYATNKQAIKDKYDQATETEYENIRTKIPGASAAKSKTTPKKKTSSKERTTTRKTVLRPKRKPKIKAQTSAPPPKKPVAKSSQRGSSSKRAV